MEPLKGAEQLLRVIQVKPRAIVRDEIGQAAVILVSGSELYSGTRMPARILPRVADQVLQCDAEQPGIAVRLDPLLDHNFYQTLRLGLPVFGDHSLRQGAQIHRLSPHLAAGYARELEQVVYELRHALARHAHAGDILLSLIVQLSGIILEQRLRETVDSPQRGPQIVRDRVAEGFELFICHLELRGALTDPLLQFGIQPPDLLLGVFAFGDVDADSADKPPSRSIPEGELIHQPVPVGAVGGRNSLEGFQYTA